MQYTTVHCDVLIIGSGGAGLRAAIELHDRKVDVLVVGKCKKAEAHTIAATGGINAALGNMDQKDTWQLHAADTIKDGGHINDTDAVMLLCKNAPIAIKELLQWGTKFAKEKNGKVSQRFFGAATYRRACFVGDKTGKAILETLVQQVQKRKIKFKSEVYIFDLLMNGKQVNGAIGFDTNTGKIIVFHAKAVILATGGHSRMFSRSSSKFWENNGDGIGMAVRCGAKTMDMEMFQFHPTGMVYPAAAEGILVTEAVRGEGGILTNAKGERFMKKYDPERMELSARDVVARAIYMEVQAGRGTKRGGVWLDISHLPKEYILKRLPKMYEQFQEFLGLDISKEKMEVGPTAHYSMGGLLTDPNTGKTTVPGLFAIGEVTAGLHGGNRLGGNSLAEIMVFGRLTGKYIAQHIKSIPLRPAPRGLITQEIEMLQKLLQTKSHIPALEAKKNLQQLMWENVGVSRNAKTMKKALSVVTKSTQSLKAGSSIAKNMSLIAALNYRNMLPICEMIIQSALYREESRAAHYRSDFPATQKRWQKNILCTPAKKGFKLSTRPVKKVPAAIEKLMHTKKSSELLE